ncbi:MAG TPA: LysE family transporter, partial [Paracoccaceae bacterium]|nr:LysE family transporter [Paracoccaceae bacterium]
MARRMAGHGMGGEGDLAGFALASLLSELVPGPNMGYLALVAAAEGRRAGLAAVGGVALGLAGLGLAAAFGIAALVAASPAAYGLLRWGGVAWLCWLAFAAWRGEETAEGAEAAGAPMWRHFRRGLVTNLLNPKAAVFFIAVQPAFLPPAPEIDRVLVFSAVFVAVATLVHAGIVALAGG